MLDEESEMKCYLVGGAIRDKLLGIPIHDRDWVVVGATVQAMLVQGYTQLSYQFPVFLHPETKEEYALARAETKIGPGRQGFTCNVAPEIDLVMDLKRRDLTINAIADAGDGSLIDPWHGIDDLNHRILRHISRAFVDDPLRLLRICRFHAKLAHLGFSIAPETKALMQEMVNSNIIAELTPEIIWQETEKALKEKSPEKYFESLAECGALTKLFPTFKLDESTLHALKNAAELASDPTIRFAVVYYLATNHGQEMSQQARDWYCKTIRLSREFSNLAYLTARYLRYLLQAPAPARVLFDLFNETHLFQHNQGRLFDTNTLQTNAPLRRLLTTCQLIAAAKELPFDPTWLIACAQKAKSCDSREVLSQGYHGKALTKKLTAKRLSIIEEFLQTSPTIANQMACQANSNRRG